MAGEFAKRMLEMGMTQPSPDPLLQRILEALGRTGMGGGEMGGGLGIAESLSRGGGGEPPDIASMIQAGAAPTDPEAIASQLMNRFKSSQTAHEEKAIEQINAARRQWGQPELGGEQPPAEDITFDAVMDTPSEMPQNEAAGDRAGLSPEIGGEGSPEAALPDMGEEKGIFSRILEFMKDYFKARLRTKFGMFQDEEDDMSPYELFLEKEKYREARERERNKRVADIMTPPKGTGKPDYEHNAYDALMSDDDGLGGWRPSQKMKNADEISRSTEDQVVSLANEFGEKPEVIRDEVITVAVGLRQKGMKWREAMDEAIRKVAERAGNSRLDWQKRRLWEEGVDPNKVLPSRMF